MNPTPSCCLLLELKIKSAVEVVRRGKRKSNTSGSAACTSRLSPDVKKMWEPGEWRCTCQTLILRVRRTWCSRFMSESFPHFLHTGSKRRILLHHVRDALEAMDDG